MKAGIAVLACLGAIALPARASFDPASALAIPGVRLVALEFYATWCKPCMAAVPAWKALHEKYRRQGLRLVVVATQDPAGGCVNPGWNPDEIVCDDDGALAARFGAQSLPAAFLWSWQGPLLVRRGHVADVENAIEAWMRETPRVEVSVRELPARGKLGKAELLALVRGQLQDQDKLIVIATEEERRRLDEVKKRSLEARFDDALQCEIGKELSANSLLEVSITGGARERLSLSLLSVERGCLVALSIVDWLPEKPNVAVAAAVAGLMQKLKRAPELPGGAVSEARPAAAVSTPVATAPPVPSPSPSAPPRAAAPPSSPLDRDGDAVSDQLDVCPDQPETHNGFVDADGCPDQLPTALTRVTGVVEVPFQSAKPALKSSTVPALDALAKALREFPDVRISIHAHSDSMGAEQYNRTLTEQRAETVRRYLAAAGIAEVRMTATGHGSDLPIASNNTAAGRAHNRRVEIHIERP